MRHVVVSADGGSEVVLDVPATWDGPASGVGSMSVLRLGGGSISDGFIANLYIALGQADPEPVGMIVAERGCDGTWHDSFCVVPDDPEPIGQLRTVLRSGPAIAELVTSMPASLWMSLGSEVERIHRGALIEVMEQEMQG